MKPLCFPLRTECGWWMLGNNSYLHLHLYFHTVLFWPVLFTVLAEWRVLPTEAQQQSEFNSVFIHTRYVNRAGNFYRLTVFQSMFIMSILKYLIRIGWWKWQKKTSFFAKKSCYLLWSSFEFSEKELMCKRGRWKYDCLLWLFVCGCHGNSQWFLSLQRKSYMHSSAWCVTCSACWILTKPNDSKTQLNMWKRLGKNYTESFWQQISKWRTMEKM